MLRPYELAIALRYVRSRNKNQFISFISVISMAGIALAVAVLIIVLSVMNGFEAEVRNRILQVVAHASITGLDGRISDWESLAAVAQMSRSHFARRFRDLLQASPIEILTSMRMRAACDLLVANHTQKEIAKRVGYSSVSAFSVAFRRHFGMTPLQYHASVTPQGESDSA